MSYRANIFSQVLQFLPKLDFQRIVDNHRGDYRTRNLKCWTWFGALIFGQLTGHNSLRAICKAFLIGRNGLRTLGFSEIKRSTFAEANEKRPLKILEDVFYYLLGRAQSLAPKSKFRFKGNVVAVDSTTISLCLSLSPWARFHHGKGAVKLHTAIDVAGDLPQFALVTEGKVHDVKAIKKVTFAHGTTVVIDRAYVDYKWLWELTCQGVLFVTRMKSNCEYRIKECRKTNRTQGIICDQSIILSSQRGGAYDGILRKISYRDPETGKKLVFLTNRFDLSPKTIADLYKSRWQIEIFFKILKHQLRIKKFLGTTVNSVKAQIWAALISYLLVAIIRWLSRLNWSIPETMAVLGVLLFVRLALVDILNDAPSLRVRSPSSQQLELFQF